MRPQASTSIRQRRRRKIASATVPSLLVGAVAILGAPAASAAITVTVINTDGQGVSSRSAPRMGATNGYGAPAGASVVANCWGWGDAVGPNNNRLWWKITYSGRTFWAADRYLSTPNIANQPPASQPACDAAQPQQPQPQPRDRAAAAALATNGHVYAHETDDNTFSNADWAPGPVGEWSGDCVKLPVAAYRKVGISIPTSSTARNMYFNYRDRGLIRQGAPVAGALVFYPDIAQGFGHVAVAINGSQIVSTMGYDNNKKANAVVGLTYFGNPAGWALPPGA
jgi:hypothetical protein